MKEFYRVLLRSFYNTDESTIFTWTTWDVQNADIVLGNHAMGDASEVFDVAISVWCQPQSRSVISIKDYRVVFSNLIQGGQSRLENIRSARVAPQLDGEEWKNWEKGYMKLMKGRNHPDPEGEIMKCRRENAPSNPEFTQLTCGPGSELVPLFSIDHEVPGFGGEIGVLQKLTG